MQRLPPGGKKVNFTLYMSLGDKEKIRERAKQLDMTVGFYLVNLCSMDSELALSEHLLSGGLIQLVPKDIEGVEAAPQEIPEPVIQPGEMPIPPDVQKMQANFADGEEFRENVSKAGSAPVEVKPTAPPGPVFQRPVMRSIQDLVAENKGPLGMVPPTQNVQPLADWQNRLHSNLQRDNTGEAAMRRQILENLPPEEKTEEGE